MPTDTAEIDYPVTSLRITQGDLDRLSEHSDYLYGLLRLLEVENDGRMISIFPDYLVALIKPAAEAASDLYTKISDSRRKAEDRMVRDEHHVWKCCPACGTASTLFEFNSYTLIHEDDWKAEARRRELAKDAAKLKARNEATKGGGA